ncbi:hypothetical protein N7478_004336 [Penicillium angulare]|uniref:uncharacterized protein n=1 Tax=Penicillium angulare TaxID=116970 RepID=UPI00253F9752|nr:uncharacterized protein N7478_004336 [Penicillium angulare]KAJ5278964.1 hypothetical protein N7478_004336 [Penicillium angulare]
MTPLPSPSPPPPASTGTTGTIAPPPPPPPPPIDPRKISPAFKLKTKAHERLARNSNLPKETRPAPIGPYFFYGSLLDPNMLTEILELDRDQEVPELRPASLGMGSGNSYVEGAVYTVTCIEHAEKLAAYETVNYQVVECEFRFTDTDEDGKGKGNPVKGVGGVFLFDGYGEDLSDGVFDLRVWLKRVGRFAALEQLEAKPCIERVVDPEFPVVQYYVPRWRGVVSCVGLCWIFVD